MSNEEREKYVPGFHKNDLRLNKHYSVKNTKKVEYNGNYFDDNLSESADINESDLINYNEENESYENEINSFESISNNNIDKEDNINNSNNFLNEEMIKYCNNNIIKEEDFIHSIVDFFQFLGNSNNISLIIEKSKDDLLKVINFLLEGKMIIDGNKANRILHVLKGSNEGGKNSLNEYLNIVLDNIKNDKI